MARIVAALSLTIVALLVAAWIANLFGQFGIGTRSGQFDYHYTFRGGCLSVSQHGNFMRQGVFWSANSTHGPDGEAIDTSSLSARWHYSYSSGRWSLQVPIVFLITAMIPIVVGSLSRFRFRLWHYFAFTAIVAVELAYFLR